MTTHDPTARADTIRRARELLNDLDENGIGDDGHSLARAVGRLQVTVEQLLDLLADRER